MKLIFIYNANSGKLNGLFDLGHKIVSPETYNCNLCCLTHGRFSEKNEWKSFRESSSHEIIFLHRDEFEQQFNKKFSYPVILKNDEGLGIFISTKELDKISESKNLIKLIEQKAEQY